MKVDVDSNMSPTLKQAVKALKPMDISAVADSAMWESATSTVRCFRHEHHPRTSRGERSVRGREIGPDVPDCEFGRKLACAFGRGLNRVPSRVCGHCPLTDFRFRPRSQSVGLSMSLTLEQAMGTPTSRDAVSAVNQPVWGVVSVDLFPTPRTSVRV